MTQPEILAIAGFLLALATLLVRTGWWIGRADTQDDAGAVQHLEIDRRLREVETKINGLPDWRGRIDERIDRDHEKHKVEERAIRKEMLDLSDRTESRRKEADAALRDLVMAHVARVDGDIAVLREADTAVHARIGHLERRQDRDV